jgi:hypothetical protein
MGVTIHYTFITRDPATVIRACRTVAEEAGRAGYRCEEVSSEGRALYMRSIIPLHDIGGFKEVKEVLDYLRERFGGFRALDEPLDGLPEDPPFAFIVLSYPDEDSFMYATPWLSLPTYRSYDRAEGAPTSVEGIMVYPPQVDDRYTAESLDILFYKIGRWYICSGFCKTQPFTADELEPNIAYHKWICDVLRKIIDVSVLWYHAYVHDEGNYYETLNELKLREAFTSSSVAIYMLANALDKALEEEDANYTVSVGGDKVDVRRLRKRAEELKGEEAGASEPSESEEQEGPEESSEHEEEGYREAEEEEYSGFEEDLVYDDLGYGRQTTLDEFLSGRCEDGK